MTLMHNPPIGLEALERRLARDLDLLCLPPANWPAEMAGPDGAPMLDVAVIGAGMYGIAAAAALVLKGVRNVALIDRAADGQEGPWITYARMETLRSPKHLPGVALGLPALTFRAWYEASFGAAAWMALYKILNHDWQDYLTWVRRTLRLSLHSRTEVLAIVPQAGRLALSLRDGSELLARRVVLASGRTGTGGAFIPPGIDCRLWPDRAAHSEAAIDFEGLRGKAVAVIGAGPSAWDNAATALEHGAARVDMYARRLELPQVNKGRGSANPGFFEGWASLPPDVKWQMLAYLGDVQSPPPHESVLRTLRLPGFQMHLGTAVAAAVPDETGVRLTLGSGGTATADFLILGTGFSVDAGNIPELAALAPDIAIWADRYTPPAGLERPEIGRFPWLGDGFELTPRSPGAPEALSRVHLFSHAAFASLGAIASDIPGVSVGAERLAHAIAAQLFVEDFDSMRARLEAFAEPELKDTPFFVPG
jgi:cation diffusion facilitator CzcD-associated flavoprotein CzcO